MLNYAFKFEQVEGLHYFSVVLVNKKKQQTNQFSCCKQK